MDRMGGSRVTRTVMRYRPAAAIAADRRETKEFTAGPTGPGGRRSRLEVDRRTEAHEGEVEPPGVEAADEVPLPPIVEPELPLRAEARLWGEEVVRPQLAVRAGLPDPGALPGPSAARDAEPRERTQSRGSAALPPAAAEARLPEPGHVA